jgi:hypothetical protein
MRRSVRFLVAAVAGLVAVATASGAGSVLAGQNPTGQFTAAANFISGDACLFRIDVSIDNLGDSTGRFLILPDIPSGVLELTPPYGIVIAGNRRFDFHTELGKSPNGNYVMQVNKVEGVPTFPFAQFPTVEIADAPTCGAKATWAVQCIDGDGRVTVSLRADGGVNWDISNTRDARIVSLPGNSTGSLVFDGLPDGPFSAGIIGDVLGGVFQDTNFYPVATVNTNVACDPQPETTTATTTTTVAPTTTPDSTTPTTTSATTTSTTPPTAMTSTTDLAGGGPTAPTGPVDGGALPPTGGASSLALGLVALLLTAVGIVLGRAVTGGRHAGDMP